MSIVEKLNKLSKILLGVWIINHWRGLVKTWRQTRESIQASQKAEELARKKYVREACTVLEKALSPWSVELNFGQRLIRNVILGSTLDTLMYQLSEWREQMAVADRLMADAKALLSQDTGNPLVIDNIVNAMALYEQCNSILFDKKAFRGINLCERELQRRKHFQVLLTQAESQAQSWDLQGALDSYQKAQQIYCTDGTKKSIKYIEIQLEKQKNYEIALGRTQKAQKEGKLVTALRILDAAHRQFPRPDGLALIEQLQKTIQGKKQFRKGLVAEKISNFSEAIKLYESAQLLLPEATNCRIRLGVIAIKTQDWSQALSHLEGLPGEHAAYLRGFVHTQQDNLQMADREWQKVSSSVMEEQRQILKSVVERKRLLYLRNIDSYVAGNNLELAETASKEFMQKFGSQPVVEYNLNQYIKPRLAAQMWQTGHWKNIVAAMEKKWLSEPSLITLHNWTVACYYYAQSDSTQLGNLIIALGTSWANLSHDPTLQDVSWLGTAVDFKAVSLELQNRIQVAIANVKAKNKHEYLNLRDRLRLELTALKLMGDPIVSGMRINDIWVAPGCYNCYYSRWRLTIVNQINAEHKILNCLYTDWGLALAACLLGNSSRAIHIKPVRTPENEIEVLAQKLIAYYESCYHLQQNKWRDAIIPMQIAQSEMDTRADWKQEIDRLCTLQRQSIQKVTNPSEQLTEHLEFAQFWYDTLKSKLAREYLAEFTAEKIRSQIADEKITLEEGLQKVRELKQIDVENPVVLDLISKIEFDQELKAIENLLKTEQLEAAVQRAKRSNYQRIRKTMAEICVEILVQSSETQELSVEYMYKLGRWAYELCPYEPDFQEIYRKLNLY